MSESREQSFHSIPWKSGAEKSLELLRKKEAELREKRRKRNEFEDGLTTTGTSFSSDIPKKQTRRNNEARKNRAVLARGVATRQLDAISDSHNRRLEREMRPAGVPTGSGVSHTAEVDALLRGGIPREAWDSDSVVPGSMDAPKRSTASFESRRGKQIIAVTPDQRRLEDIAAPDFSVSEDDDDDDLFDGERTIDGENSSAQEEDEYALLAKKYGITLPEDKPFESKVDQEIIPKREGSSGLADITVLESGSSFQSGGRNVRVSMDHRKSHKHLTFTPDDIVIQPGYESGFRQDTPQKGRETGRRRHLQGLEQQFERGGLLNLSHIPKEKIKIVGGSRQIVETAPREKPVSKPDYRYEYHRGIEKKKSLSDQAYELAVRKVPETLERHNRKQKFVHKILDWDLNAIEERDFSYEIPFEELDFVDPSPKESEAMKKYANFYNFLSKIEDHHISEKKVKVLHEMFLMLYDFYRLQGDIILKVSKDLNKYYSDDTIQFTDPGEEIIKKFEKYFSEYSDKFFADEIKEIFLLIQIVEKDLDYQKKHYSAKHEISRKQFFVEQAKILVEEINQVRNFFSKN